jgi:uncharacterized membrane-anchored protein YhcB (DUF1043 family)
MIPESISLKLIGLVGGALAGLTVLVRLGRLLEALETVQARMDRIEDKLDRYIEGQPK